MGAKCFWCVACVVLAGCGSSDEKATPKLDATLRSLVVDECAVVVEGVKVCVDGRPEIPCATTDASGIADLAIPKNAELVISYQKDGFVPKLREYVSDQDVNTGLGTWFLQRTTWYETESAKLGGQFDFTKGIVGFQTDALLGLTSGLDPAEGQATADIKGPIQFQVCKQTGCPGPCICTGSTTCDAGTVGYGDVPLGKWKATFSAPGLTCTPKGFACKDGTPNCVEIESRAGFNAFAFMHCALP
jgi:hypothetical protein